MLVPQKNKPFYAHTLIFFRKVLHDFEVKNPVFSI